MDFVVFWDNDVILKLSEYNLLDDACNALGVASDQVRVLPSAKHYFLRMCQKIDKGGAGSYSVAGLERAISFAEQAHAVEDYSNLDWLADCDDIDIGEAQLATWAAGTAESALLLTGDKRFLKALARHDAARDVFYRLAGRVVCLEELVKALIEHLGFERVQEAVASSPQCDRALSNVFGSRFDLPESQVLAGLESLVRGITRDVGDNWLKRS